MPNQDLYHIPIEQMDGTMTTLQPWQGKVLLIVNVASRCGFTPQYAELEALYQTYQKEGLVILGFPCNQFGKQEPEENAAIQSFAESCFRVTFPLFAKVAVKGAEQAPLYRYLQQNIQKKPWIFIPWNFTKILVDRQGQVLERFLPTTSLTKIKKKLIQLL